MTERSAHLLAPGLADVLAQMPRFDLSEATLGPARAAVDEMFAQGSPEVAGVESAQLHVRRPDGGEIRVLSYRPTAPAGPMPLILHMHGGGFILGSPEMADAEHKQLAATLGCLILSVDYRLAPEAPYPAAAEDGYAVLEWAWRNAGELGIDRSRIAVKGESAGGALAAALSLMARDRGEIAIVLQVLTFPALDDRTGAKADAHPYCGEYIWNGVNNVFAWRCYLGDQDRGLARYAAPARTEDLADLPPAFIAVGALDLYLEEDLEYARRLTRGGVPVELHVYPGAVHGFTLASGSRTDRNAAADLRDALASAFRPADPAA